MPEVLVSDSLGSQFCIAQTRTDDLLLQALVLALLGDDVHEETRGALRRAPCERLLEREREAKGIMTWCEGRLRCLGDELLGTCVSKLPARIHVLATVGIERSKRDVYRHVSLRSVKDMPFALTTFGDSAILDTRR